MMKIVTFSHNSELSREALFTNYYTTKHYLLIVNIYCLSATSK